MSYIRSYQNPEGLYIFGNDKKQIEIAQNGTVVMKIPRYVFYKVCKDSSKGKEKIKYRGLKIEEEFISGSPKIKLNFKGCDIYMWDVTWSYIVHDVMLRT